MKRLVAKGSVDAGRIRTKTIMYSSGDPYWHPRRDPRDSEDDIDHDLIRKQRIEQDIADE